MAVAIKIEDNKKELSDLSKRFMKVLEVKKYTGYRFSKDNPDLLEATITKIRTGRVEPSKTYISALCKKFPDLSFFWLLTGEGEMFTDGSMQSIPQKTKPTGYYLPDVSAAAGMDTEINNSELKRIPVDIPGWETDVIFINVYGDSMYPKYNAGEIIGVKPIEFHYLNYGYPYVVVFQNGDVHIKIVQPGSTSEHLILESVNDFYKPKEFHLERLKSFYSIKGVIKKEMM